MSHGFPVCSTSQPHRRFRLGSVLCLLASLLIARAVRAGDRIVLQPDETATPLTLVADIADFNSETIELMMTVGQPVRTYPTRQVLQVETVHTEPHRRGVSLFESERWAEASQRFTEALAAEPRPWIQREILGWKVRCALQSGDRLAACAHFLEILNSHEHPREWPLIPLVWEPEPISDAMARQARTWLVDESQAARLMGASLLLQHPLYASVARSELQTLSRTSTRSISSLARAQLWRLQVVAEDLSDIQLAEYERQIESMPSDLRAGPYFLLARMYQHRSDLDRATAAYLWLPTVYSENETLTARACLEAGILLERQGRLSMAQSLLQEVTAHHGWSPAAAEARLALQRLSDTTGKSPESSSP